MHAALRRMKCAPGKAPEVARLIEAEYIPQLTEIDGVVSYTLVQLDGDEVASLGVFISEQSAVRANELAMAWAKDRLSALGAASLEALDGEVLLHSIFPS
jgi:hypothetical protein